MSSISKLTPVAATFELAPALANLNFDFSLWKVEAPKEFDGVGSALSTIRRDEAENGLTHITARKLGALFQTILPSTPNLTRAYGQRASEISQTSSVSPQTRVKYGVFSSRVGSDATSIWAAATSGPAAIAVHLLACLLARMWDGPEATSIWAEIVQRRREIVHAEMSQNNIIEMTTLAAAKQDITRAQIAEWDASARSWLRTADAVKSLQQKQLTLIIDNVQGSVNQMSDTYDSVVTAWKNSLTQMDGLIEGISQQATSGEILLALSAWHLFPDMVVVNPCTTQVDQHDQIFTSGGVLTIGLEKPDPDRTGVYWSLPLARLRHYGAPVVSSCSIDSSERSRLSLDELVQAVLGCFLQGWGEAGLDTSAVIGWLSRLSRILNDAAFAGSVEAKALISGDAEYSWLNLLFSAAKHHMESTGNEKLVARKLISLGRRHGKAFLGIPRAPLFGLLHRGGFVGLIENEDDRIDFLRKVAKDACKELRLESHQIFIRYRHKCLESSKSVYEYATAMPWNRHSTKRKLDQSEQRSEVHRRWLYAGSMDLRRKRLSDQRYDQRLNQNYGRSYPLEDWDLVPDDFAHWHAAHGHVRSVYHSDREYFDIAESNLIRQDFECRTKDYTANGEEVIERESQPIEDFAPDRMGIFWDQMGRSYLNSRQTPWYRSLYGETNIAAIFVLEGEEKLTDLIHTVRQDSHEMYSLFELNKMDSTSVVNQLARIFQTANVEADPHMQSAKAFSTAAMIYKKFPDATVDVRVIQCKLWQAQWVRSAVARRFNSQQMMPTTHATPLCLEHYLLDRASAFACITMFESGRYDVNPFELENVMAMSSGDSIYVGAALLCDPSQESYSGAIKRVAGNIGRPGIAFLVPPVDPLIKAVSISEWPRMGRSEFDWKLRNCFENTSLHLSFTGASTPVNLDFSGGQDADVYMLETLVSVHDNGRWIADLNILKTFRSTQLILIPLCSDRYQHGAAAIPSIPKYPMTSIDNWLELVDTLEEHICVVQAYGNWEARLATGSISIAKHYFTLVAPENVCWICLENTISKVSSYRPVIVII